MTMRKEMGLEISDRIVLAWEGDHADVVELFATWGSAIAVDVQADSVERTTGIEGEPVDVAGRPLRLRLARA
jgi:hypothetical protein